MRINGLAILAIVMGLYLFAPVLAVQETIYAVSLDMNGIYAPAKFIVEFSLAQNVSAPMSSLSGHALWTVQTSPVGIQIDLKDVDSYTGDVHLVYNSTVDQVIAISYWSGDLAPNTERYHVVGDDIWIHFSVVVSTEPKPPSKEEIAQEVVMQVKQDLADYMGQISLLVDQLQNTVMTMWALIGVAFVTSILSLIVSFYAIRSSHQEKRR